jgi:hypothetical protein
MGRFFLQEPQQKRSNIIVIVHSGAALSEARMEQRESCGPLHKTRGIELVFAVGHRLRKDIGNVVYSSGMFVADDAMVGQGIPTLG